MSGGWGVGGKTPKTASQLGEFCSPHHESVMLAQQYGIEFAYRCASGDQIIIDGMEFREEVWSLLVYCSGKLEFIVYGSNTS